MNVRLAFALSFLLPALLLAKSSDAEWQQAKAEAMRDLGASDATTRIAAVKKLAAADRQEAADLLLKLSGMAQKALTPLYAEKARLLGHLDKYNGRNAFTQEEVDKMQALQEEMAKVGEKMRVEELVRTSVVEALGRFVDADAVKWLLATPLKGSSWEDRAVVAEACATIGDAAVVPALIDRVKADTDPRVRTAAIDSLGKKKATEAASTVAGALTDDDWQVQISALQALGEFGAKEGIEPIVALMDKSDGRVRKECSSALARITGEKLGDDPAIWRRWWEDHKSGWAGPKAAGDEVKPPSDPNGTTVTFYGIPVESKRLVFVLDISGSMREPADAQPQQVVSGGPGDVPPPKAGATKMEVAKYELKKAIWGLDPKAQFNIIFFSNTPEKWAPALVTATPANKAAAYALIDKQEPTAATNIYDSLEMAFNMALNGAGNVVVSDKNFKSSVDTIFLMSDGAPNQGQIVQPDEILAKIKQMNRLRKVIINVIGVGRDQVESFMRSLAEQNGGRYVKR